MKVTHIRIRKADGPLTVMDAFVDKGLTEGGHASLPDIDVDYASDRRQEIKDYLELWAMCQEEMNEISKLISNKPPIY